MLLDWGLAMELSPSMRRNFLSFLVAVAAGDGARAVSALVLRGASSQGRGGTALHPCART